MRTTKIGKPAVLLLALAGADARAANDMGPTLAAQTEVRVMHHPTRKIFLVASTAYRTGVILLTPLVVVGEVSESIRLKNDLGLEDPIAFAEERLIAVLERDAALRNLRAVPEIVEDGDLDAIKGRFASGLVLSLVTKHWGMDNNRVKYYAEARLYDLDASSELWRDHCRWVVVDKGQRAPEREALTANHGALLKANLQRAAELCADELAGRLVDATKTREAVAIEARRSAPSASPAAAGFAGLPQVGDRWEYSYVDATTAASRRAEVKIESVAADEITERVAIAGVDAGSYRHGPAPDFAFNRLWVEFSPYLPNYPGAAERAATGQFSASAFGTCRRPNMACTTTVRTAGSERIQTPMGELDVTKVVVTLSSSDSVRAAGSNMSSKRELTYWYSVQAKRLVKARARTLSGFSLDPDYDVDLVSYELH